VVCKISKIKELTYYESSSKNSNKKMVMQYLNENFDLSYFQVVDFPFLPGGKILIDQRGEELLFYYDFLHGEVKWKMPNKK